VAVGCVPNVVFSRSKIRILAKRTASSKYWLELPIIFVSSHQPLSSFPLTQAALLPFRSFIFPYTDVWATELGDKPLSLHRPPPPSPPLALPLLVAASTPQHVSE
jgi:hypothetical protein